MLYCVFQVTDDFVEIIYRVLKAFTCLLAVLVLDAVLYAIRHIVARFIFGFKYALERFLNVMELVDQLPD